MILNIIALVSIWIIAMSSSYSTGALEMISQSSFRVMPGVYIYAKVAELINAEDHFLVARDATEITIVTLSTNISDTRLLERNKDDYALIALNVCVPFYSVGFLATVTDALAEVGLNVLVVSTYSRDYILVRADLLNVAESTLLNLGFSKA